MKTLQIATFCDDSQEGIAIGIKNFPIHYLILICYSSDTVKDTEYAINILNLLIKYP
jgi:hypothetical protein